MWSLPLLFLALLAFWLSRSLQRRKTPEAWTLPRLTNELDRIERLLLEGNGPHANASLSQIEASVMRLQGPDGLVPRARFRLLAADLFAWTGRPDQARQQLDQVLVDLDGPVDAARGPELRTRAEAARGLPTLPPDARTTFAGVAAHSRGMQHLAENHPDEARRSLDQAEALARQARALPLVRAAAADLGRLELGAGRATQAEPHLRRALETQVPGESAPEEHARRAEILWLLSDAHMMMERPEQALRDCRRAFDLGRSAGNAAGREVAAVMAFRLGEADGEEPGGGRRYFEIAAQLGRLSGRPRGREVAELADTRLRDMGG